MADEIVTIEITGNVAVVTLNIAEITIDISEKLPDDVTLLAREHPGLAVVLDVSALTFMGSLGVTTLIILHKRLCEAERPFLIVGLGGQPRREIELMRLTRVFELHPDVPSALEAIQDQR